MTALTTDSLDTEREMYATLMETNGEECESWYYFVSYASNREALEYLKAQIDEIEMYILDDLSTFDIELEHLISAESAKQMTKLELNSVMFHRKFDGKLEHINIGLKKKDSNEKRIERINQALGMGSIEDYIGEEDIDSEDLASDSDDEEGLVESDHSDDEDLIPLPLGELSLETTSVDSDALVVAETQSAGSAQVAPEKKKKKKKKKN